MLIKPETLKENILKLLKNSQKPQDFIEIAKNLQISKRDNKELSKIIFELCDTHKIEKTQDGFYFYLDFIKSDTYNISISTKRLGFVDFDIDKSALLLPFQLNAILDGDLVDVEIYSYNQDNKILYRAYIKNIIEHKKQVIVGNFIKKQNDQIFFEAVDAKDSANFFINVPTKFYYDLKQFVKVKVLAPRKNAKKVDLEFIEYIGKTDDKRIIEKKIIVQNNVDTNFSFEVLEEAKLLPKQITSQDYEGRKNLENLFTVTIDGNDTKDFDDAISCLKTDSGYKLWVHIADVSHYVKENSFIDQEALKRGTSIYLPDKVIPMLPFELSNGICSINPQQLRAVLTLELDLDEFGLNTKYQIYPSIIKSNYRLTYDQVNDFYEGRFSFENTETNQMLTIAKEISLLIRKQKLLEGYVDFEIIEPKIILNNEGDVIDIKLKQSGFSETMIEDFMVRANETVAKMMYDKKIPSIYRIHDLPSDEKLYNLQQILNFLNIDIKVPFSGDSKEFAQMVLQLKEIKFDDFIKMYLLRTLQKAKYSEQNIGHFGLASKFYSHFTSPIRRYPDLLLHRLIRNYIFNQTELKLEDKDTLSQKIHFISELNSDSENIALNVERNIVDLKKSEFFEKFVNTTIQATAISVEKFGIFFESPEYKTSILVRFEDMKNEEMIQVSNLEAKSKIRQILAGNNYSIRITEIDPLKGNISAIIV
ncbi:ribonuclease R [Mycoplasma miroungirhinis]|uniref:Ribonuclease R n=1 Tax=Mycoplasma miroungirhinis TaxID=754516 RepID=A0A6M4JAX3_9MOLU|nr:ribonuclease R [Mycoplasma miroungirhinis]QJR44144.1 ribonuclease R [Mycoplasma miroungirhinis]